MIIALLNDVAKVSTPNDNPATNEWMNEWMNDRLQASYVICTCKQVVVKKSLSLLCCLLLLAMWFHFESCPLKSANASCLIRTKIMTQHNTTQLLMLWAMLHKSKIASFYLFAALKHKLNEAPKLASSANATRRREPELRTHFELTIQE